MKVFLVGLPNFVTVKHSAFTVYLSDNQQQ